MLKQSASSSPDFRPVPHTCGPAHLLLFSPTHTQAVKVCAVGVLKAHMAVLMKRMWSEGVEASPPSKRSLMRNWSSLFPSTMALLWIKRTLTALEVIQLANSSQTPTNCSDIVICGVYLAKQIWTRLATCPSPILPSFSIISNLSCTFYPIKRDEKARKSSHKNPLKHLQMKFH